MRSPILGRGDEPSTACAASAAPAPCIGLETASCLPPSFRGCILGGRPCCSAPADCWWGGRGCARVRARPLPLHAACTPPLAPQPLLRTPPPAEKQTQTIRSEVWRGRHPPLAAPARGGPDRSRLPASPPVCMALLATQRTADYHLGSLWNRWQPGAGRAALSECMRAWAGLPPGLPQCAHRAATPRRRLEKGLREAEGEVRRATQVHAALHPSCAATPPHPVPRRPSTFRCRRGAATCVWTCQAARG